MLGTINLLLIFLFLTGLFPMLRHSDCWHPVFPVRGELQIVTISTKLVFEMQFHFETPN